LAGTSLAIFRLAQTHRNFVAPAAFDSLALRMCKQGQLDRLKKVCDSVPNSTYPRAVRAALTALDTRTGDDRETLFAAAQDAYRGQFGVRRTLGGGTGMDATAALLTFLPAGAALGDASLPRVWLWGLPAVSLLALIYAARLRRQTQSRSVENVSELLDAIVDAKRGETTDPSRDRGVYRAAAPIEQDEPSDARSLRVTLRGVDVDRHTLPDKGVLKIGRLKSADIFLEHPTVARLHAVLEVEPDKIEIIDLGSPSGLIVNGERTNQRRLGAGDKIQIGAYHLELTHPTVRDTPPFVPPGPQIDGWTCARCGSGKWSTVTVPKDLAATMAARACDQCGEVSWRAEKAE
jgi:hypothetical protein